MTKTLAQPATMYVCAEYGCSYRTSDDEAVDRHVLLNRRHIMHRPTQPYHAPRDLRRTQPAAKELYYPPPDTPVMPCPDVEGCMLTHEVPHLHNELGRWRMFRTVKRWLDDDESWAIVVVWFIAGLLIGTFGTLLYMRLVQ